MEIELKKKVVAALRSGDYKQGKGSLRNTSEEFCPLGVILNVYNAKLWEKPKSHSHEYSYMGVVGSIPIQLEKVIGLDWEKARKIWLMNDSEGKSFAQIADYIEKL